MRELQSFFNSGGYVERALVEGYACCVYESRVITLPGVVGDVRVSLVGWREATGRVRFYAQCFQTESGDLVPGTFLDPKYIFGDDGIHYKLSVPPSR